jgi:hypothetical protein
MRFEILTAVDINIIVFWMFPCSPVERCQRFGVIFPEHGGSMFIAKLESTYQTTRCNIAEDCNLNIHIHVQVILCQLTPSSKDALHHGNSEARNSICICKSVDWCSDTVNIPCYRGITPCTSTACNAVETVTRVLVMCHETDTYTNSVCHKSDFSSF